MLGRLASSASWELAVAAADALCDLCRVSSFELGGVLRISPEPPRLEVRLEATGQHGHLRELCEAFSSDTHRLLQRELAWSSPCVVDCDDPIAGTEELARELARRGLSSAALTNVTVEGDPCLCLLLASRSKNLLDGAIFSRLRLIADVLSLALSLLNSVLARRELEARVAEIGSRPTAPVRLLTDAEIRELERENLLRTLESCEWRIQGPRGAASALGLCPSTFRDRMKSFGIARPARAS